MPSLINLSNFSVVRKNNIFSVMVWSLYYQICMESRMHWLQPKFPEELDWQPNHLWCIQLQPIDEDHHRTDYGTWFHWISYLLMKIITKQTTMCGFIGSATSCNNCYYFNGGFCSCFILDNIDWSLIISSVGVIVSHYVDKKVNHISTPTWYNKFFYTK